MKTHRLTTALLLATAVLTGCGEPATSGTDPAAATTPIDAAAPVTDARSGLNDALRQRLLALDYYASQMWADDQPDVPLAWLKASAKEHGVTLAGVMPEQVAVAESVATRRMGVRAEGGWEELLSWLTAIEDSPRRFVARNIALYRLRGRSVADLQLTALLDRPAGLRAVGAMDLTSIDATGLADVIERLDADLKQKGQTLERLGADVSWAQPIAMVTENLPDAGVMIRLELNRGDLGGRAQRFAGSFIAQVRRAGDVDPMVAALNVTEGFAEAELIGGRDVGAGFRRAEVTFTYGRPAEAKTDGAPVADDSGAGLRRNPFHGAVARANTPAATPRSQVVGNVLLGAARLAGSKATRRNATRTGPTPRGPRTGRATTDRRFRFDTTRAGATRRGPRNASGAARPRSRFDDNRTLPTSRGPRDARARTVPQSRTDTTRTGATTRGPRDARITTTLRFD